MNTVFRSEMTVSILAASDKRYSQLSVVCISVIVASVEDAALQKYGKIFKTTVEIDHRQ